MAGEQQLVSMDFSVEEDEEEGGEIIVSLPGDNSDVKIVKAGEKTPAATEAEADPIKDLKSQFATMTQRVSSAERAVHDATQQANEASARAARAEGALVDSQLDTVMSGISAAKSASEAAKRDFIAAAEAGDFAAQAEAQERIGDARARLQRLEEAAEDLKEQAEVRKVQVQKTPPRAPQRQQNPVEDFITGQQVTPKSAAWIRAHPDFVTDRRANARVMAAHNQAIADDVEMESDEYFQRIDAAMTQTQTPKKADPVPQPRQHNQPGTRPSSAAAAGGNPGGNGTLNGGGTEVKLTRGEARSATDGTLVWNYDDPSGQNRFKKGDPIGLAEMARRKYHGTKAGLYDKSHTET